MSQFSYNDGLCNGNRTPKLWIVHRGQIHRFDGSTISSVCAITSTAYQKNGKWSNTTYQLELADGAVGCVMLAPLHGQVWPMNDRMEAYKSFMAEFGVTLSFDAFDAALLRDYPNSHARMVAGEKALESLSPEGDSELVEISTSKSCNRNPHDDVRVTAPDGRTWVVAHEARTAEVSGVFKLTDIKHVPGYKGGTTTLVFAVAPGVKVQGEYYPKDGEAHVWAMGRNGDGTEPPKVEVPKFGTNLGDLLGKAGIK